MYLFLFHLILYIISAQYVRVYYMLAYSPTGIWSCLKQNTLEWILIFIPAFNTAFAIYFWFTEHPTKIEHQKQNRQHFRS